MIRSFFSRKFFSLTSVLSLVLGGQLAFAPVALAAGQKQTVLDQYLQSGVTDRVAHVLQDAEAQGYRVTDLQGGSIRAEDFIEKASADFIVTSPATSDDRGFAYRMHIQNKDGLAVIGIAVTRPGEAQVLGRRAFTLDSSADATTLRVRLAETEHSLDEQVRLMAGEQHASLWQRTTRTLQSIFGIQSAHADALGTGVRMVLTFAGVGVLTLAATGIAQHYGVVGAATARYVLLAGLAITVVAYYMNFDTGPETKPRPIDG